jgi:hypothetical protein
MKVNLICGDKIADNTDYRDALPVNMFAIKKDILGAKGYMAPYYGITQFGYGFGADRGGVFNDNKNSHYRVSAGKFINVGVNGAVAEIGDIPGSGQAAMPYSFNTQAIIADGKMFLYGGVDGFVQVTDADIGTPIDGTWIDGYYFLTDGEYLYHTELTDETAINSLAYATAEFMPDRSIGVAKTQDNKVIVFGRYTIEYFVNVATEFFAFTRIDSRAQKIGIVATHAKCEVAGEWYITGGRKEDDIGVYVIGVGSSTKISSREIDKIINQYTEPELSDMRMEGRKGEGTTFVIVHLPRETICFNREIADAFGAEYAWCILKTGVQGQVAYGGINCVFDPRNGKFVLGDRARSNLGYLDDTVFSQYDERQEFILYSPFIDLNAKSIDEIKIETIPGRNTVDDAKVFFSMSKYGNIFGNEYSMGYGEPADYQKQFILRRLGYVNSWAGFKFRGTTKSRMSFANFDLKAK